MELPGDIPRNFAFVGVVEQEWISDIESYRRRKQEEEANERLLANLDMANRLGSTDPRLGEWALGVERRLTMLEEAIRLLERTVEALSGWQGE